MTLLASDGAFTLLNWSSVLCEEAIKSLQAPPALDLNLLASSLMTVDVSPIPTFEYQSLVLLLSHLDQTRQGRASDESD